MISDAAALIERETEKTFPVAGRAQLRVDTFYGGIQVVATDTAEVQVRVRQSIDVPTETAADRQLKDVELTFETTPEGVINVRARYKRSVRWTWEKWPPMGLTIEASVPAGCDLDLISRDGGITVGNLRGNLKVRAEQGPIFIGAIEGTVTASSERGDIAVTACAGSLKAEARTGNVIVGRASGPAEISAGGAVEVQSGQNTVRAESESSDLKVGFMTTPPGPCELRAARGDVTASFTPNISVTLDVQASSFGKVSARDLSLALTRGELGSSRIQGQLNGGGALVSIRSSRGNVRLLGVPGVPAP